MGSLAMMVLKVCDKLVKIALTGGARKVSYIQEFIALRTVKVMSVNPFRFSCFSQQQVHLWKKKPILTPYRERNLDFRMEKGLIIL